MADPNVVEKLDGLDRLTVRLYRLGIALAGITLLLAGGLGFFPNQEWNLLPLMAVSCGLIASSLHIYDKKIRWIMMGTTWVALMLYPSISQWFSHPLLYVGVQGLCYITLSGIALKENYCFKIFGIKWIPALLGVSVFSLGLSQLWPSFLGWLHWVFILTNLGAGGLYFVMAMAKWRMPLHYDIGKKSKYQI